MKFHLPLIVIAALRWNAADAFQPRQPSSVKASPKLEFQIHDHEYEKDGSVTKVMEVPVRQEGIKMYIANDGDLQSKRPGNGGMRLLSYETEQHAIEDAVRLAEGMT
ncbi:MAG: hypothetical protein SGARI_001988, partial [Bacillariaceae sp.]